MDLDLEHHGGAGQILGVIVLGEGDVHVLLVAGLGANQLILKAGDKGAGAQLQAVALGLAAVKGNAVLEALEVDDHGVAVLSLTLHGHHTAGAVDVGLELVVDVLVGDLDLFLLSGETLVLAQLHLRTDSDGGLKGQAVLAGLQNLHVGPGHHVQLLLLHGIGIGLGIELVDGIFIEHAGAEHTLDDLPGSLALPEAGHVDLVALLQISLLDRGLKLLAADLDDQLHGALFLLLDAFDIHLVNFLLSAPGPGQGSRTGQLSRYPLYIIRCARKLP